MMKSTMSLILYYSIARFLKAIFLPYGGKYFKILRYILCKNISQYCGKNVNVERLAFFGTGKYIKIGNNSGIRDNCRILDNTILINDVTQLYHNPKTHLFNDIDFPMRIQGRTNLKKSGYFW